ncbi:MAG: hypothetical protein LQ349_004908 [Xanthoria aureola]|nr:MAG: hypothetical protein LQ349_004908 [Xanthoria aureola]
MSSIDDDVYLLSHQDHLSSLPQLVHILCGPSQTAIKVIRRILESSPFRHEYDRQHANTDNGMVMCLPDDNAGAVTRLLVYTHRGNSYRKYPRELSFSKAEEVAEDYLLANQYGAQCVKKDIIEFLELVGRGRRGDYSRWLDFATKVYQGLGERDVRFQKYFKLTFYEFWSYSFPTLLDLDTDGFKSLMFKGGFLAMDVFDVYERVRADHQRFLSLRKEDEKDAEEDQRN